jgi:hypothetical protein
MVGIFIKEIAKKAAKEAAIAAAKKAAKKKAARKKIVANTKKRRIEKQEKADKKRRIPKNKLTRAIYAKKQKDKKGPDIRPSLTDRGASARQPSATTDAQKYIKAKEEIDAVAALDSKQASQTKVAARQSVKPSIAKKTAESRSALAKIEKELKAEKQAELKVELRNMRLEKAGKPTVKKAHGGQVRGVGKALRGHGRATYSKKPY